MSDVPIRRDGESLSDFAKRLKEEAAAKAAPTWDADLVPQTAPTERSREQLEIDAVLNKVDIVDAYVRWCGKMTPDVRNKRESIMVSCPNPNHPDKHPSAWLNLDKGDGGVGRCEPCDLGFDKYDIAAWHFGFNVPGYKGKEFPDLRRRMAEGLGYRVVVQGKVEWLEPILQPTTSNVITLSGNPTSDPGDDTPVPDETPEPPTFDWRQLGAVKPETFLHEWLTLTSESYEPEEYYFWLGLMALGNAVGNKVRYDDTIPVRPNLMACLTGPTGTGKSIAISFFEELLRRALPFDRATGSGVRMIASPGSGEALLDQYHYEVLDTTTNTKTIFPINGLYRESELASFVKKTGRAGNTMREIIMDLYDRSLPVSGQSRGTGLVTASDHYMSMVTSTQPDSISRLLSDADAAAGFLNRWIFAFGAGKVRPPRNAVRIDVTPCSDLLRHVRAWSSPGRLVKFFDGPAADLWDHFYLTQVHPLTMQEDAWMAARLPLLAKKIMLLLAINDKATTIFTEHVQTVIDLWPYLLKSYGIIGTNVGMSEVQDCRNKIEQYLKERVTEQFTFREISKQSGARRFPHETIKKALELLMWSSNVEEVPRYKNDRVARYRYVTHTSAALASVTPIAVVP